MTTAIIIPTIVFGFGSFEKEFFYKKNQHNSQSCENQCVLNNFVHDFNFLLLTYFNN